jgi:hypothetical protein
MFQAFSGGDVTYVKSQVYTRLPVTDKCLPSSLAAKVEAKITAWQSVPMTVLQRFKQNGAPEDHARNLQGFEMVQ